jgi:toxin ParE1/3/4
VSGLAIVWRAEARNDLASIVRYIANHNPSAARRMKSVIEAAVLPLSEHPFIYRPGRVPGTRELVAHPNYVVVYRVTSNQVEIINVLHARQQYPQTWLP